MHCLSGGKNNDFFYNKKKSHKEYDEKILSAKFMNNLILFFTMKLTRGIYVVTINGGVGVKILIEL